MELKQNLFGNYKENKRIETKNETKNFLIERDNEIFKLDFLRYLVLLLKYYYKI